MPNHRECRDNGRAALHFDHLIALCRRNRRYPPAEARRQRPPKTLLSTLDRLFQSDSPRAADFPRPKCRIRFLPQRRGSLHAMIASVRFKRCHSLLPKQLAIGGMRALRRIQQAQPRMSACSAPTAAAPPATASAASACAWPIATTEK